MIGESGDVRGEGTMGEASVAVRGLGGMSEPVAARGRVVSALGVLAVKVLHVEQVRGDKRVPPVVR